MSDPIDQLKTGKAAVPALKYAYGLIGIAGTATTIIGSFTSPQIAVSAIVLTLIGMILVWLFSRLTDDTKHEDPAARVLVWASVGAFVCCVVLLLSLAVRRQPAYLADLLKLPQPVQTPSHVENEIITAMFAALPIDASKIDPKIHEDHRAALLFIETYAKQYCSSADNLEIKKSLNCGSGAGSLSVQTSTVPANLPSPSTISLTYASVPPGDACAQKALTKTTVRPSKIFGLDVSHFGSSETDWHTLASNGYFFAFIMATQGLSFVDPKFKDNWEAAGRAGMIRAAYHYLGAGDGSKEASFFLTALKQVPIGPCDIGAALDFEQDLIHTESQPTKARVDQAEAWRNAVKAALGKQPILYSTAPYLRTLGDPSSLAAYPLWIASYASAPLLPPSRSSYSFWQFSDGHMGPQMGQASGVSTSLFNGTPAELFALTR